MSDNREPQFIIDNEYSMIAKMQSEIARLKSAIAHMQSELSNAEAERDEARQLARQYHKWYQELLEKRAEYNHKHGR